MPESNDTAVVFNQAQVSAGFHSYQSFHLLIKLIIPPAVLLRIAMAAKTQEALSGPQKSSHPLCLFVFSLCSFLYLFLHLHLFPTS